MWLTTLLALDKTVKLWKLTDKYKQASGFNLIADDGHEINAKTVGALKVPHYMPLTEKSVEASCKRMFANAHTYHINSVSINSDGENFMSADDLRINLWNVEVTDQCFSKLQNVCQLISLDSCVFGWCAGLDE